MTGEITLAVGASAEPNTCGSCKFFRRTMDMGDSQMSNGICGFVLPPKMHVLFSPRVFKDQEEGQSRMRLSDKSRCDLYQSDGRRYIVQRQIGPY